MISYGPFSPKSPTNPCVVEQSVQYCMDVLRKHGQEYAIITCDQAIFELVLGLQKKNKEKYAKLIVHMGGFHIDVLTGAVTSCEDVIEAGGISNPLLEIYY